MGLPNNVRAAMAIEGRTHEFIRRSCGKCGCYCGSSTGLWLTCLTLECSPTHSHDETLVNRFDVTMVTLSSSLDDVMLIGVGSEAGSQAETKCLHLFANP
jgi:hypothetical protein